MGSGAAGVGIVFIIMFIVFFAIGVALSRWIFRVNDIVDRLERIADILQNKPVAPPVKGPGIEIKE